MPSQSEPRLPMIKQIDDQQAVMFRLESYITPLVMNYIDRYVKLKPQDFQMSLWGGAAVLNQLDLRLDAIETALNLPIQLTNGHISELKIQVPWTKLGFEPVVVTINTMECVISLRNADSVSEAGSTEGSITNPKSSSKSKKSSKQDPDVPPGYIQSLLNRIMNNVNVVVENLILKFVEEDIVFSMNIKTVEIFSVNNEWKRAFAELSAPDFVLRRLVEFTDLTVCLDKTKYDNIHSAMPSTTKIHTMCDELNLSLTDTQLPLFARLIELMLAIYYGDVSLSPADTRSIPHTSESPAQAEEVELVSPIEESSPGGGWASWAWSMVPQVLPEENEDSSSSSSGESRAMKPSPPVFDISFYNRKATLVIKLSRYMHSKSVKASAPKVLFEPLAELKLEGIALEILAKGLIFLDVQIGFTAASINGIGDCICATALPKSSQGAPMLEAGDRQPKQGLHYLTGSLFDTSSHHGSISTHIFDYDKHCQKYKESWAVERFGALWINYLWIEEPQTPSSIGDSKHSTFKPDFIDESTHMKFWFHRVALNFNSDMKHRLDKFLYCLSDHTYEPYAKHTPEVVDASRPTPSTEQVKALERFIPVKDIHLAFLRCCINAYPANHPDVDVSVAKSSRGRRSQPVAAACWLKLYSERVDMQTTAPMYPRRLVKLISALPSPSGNLIHHCRYHRNIKLMGLTSEVCRQHASPHRSSIIRPLSAAYYRNVLALPVYWTTHDVEISSSLYELPEVTVQFSFPLLKTALSVWNSWSSSECREKLHSTSLVADAFSVSGEFPVVDVSFSRFEMKQSSGNNFQAAFGNIGSICVSVITKGGDDQLVSTILQAPADTTLVSQGHVFTTTKAIAECSDDFLCFTYQLPAIDEDHIGDETTVVLCTMQGWTATADPILLDLLLYQERPMSLPDLQRRLETSSPPVGSSLPRHLSEVTLKSETSSATPSFNEQKHPEHSARSKSSPVGKSESKKSSNTWLDYLPTMHSLSQNIAVNVKVSSGCVLIPAATLTNLPDSGEHIMAKQWRQLAYSGSIPRSLVICLPSITATSHNISVSPPVEDFPIRSESSRATSLPIIVGIESFSVYTYISRACNNLLESVSSTSTITLLSQYKQHEPGQQKCLLSLALSAQHSVGHVVANISNEQVELLCELTSVWLKLLPLVLRLGGGAGTTPSEEETAVGEMFSTHSNSQPSMHSMHDTVSYTEPANSELSHSSVGDVSGGSPCNVKLSFRTEAKLSHICLNLFLKQQGYRFECVRGVGEEVSAHLDVYKNYFKIQSKIWSIELLHGFFDQRCEEFVTGSRHGILLSSCRRFINLQQMDAVKDTRHLSQLMKEQPREGILTITYTSASHQSLKQRDVDCASQLSGKKEGYITELCLDMAKCDVIFHLPAIVSTMQMLLVDSLPALQPLLELLPAKMTSEATKREAQSPWFHSQTLPLIHLTAGETRFFFPVDELAADKQDVIIFSVHGVELTPQAENPLSRLVLDNDLFKRSVSKMNTPGSIVEDRQLQMDLIGLSLLAGTWSEMVLEDKGLCPSSFENPAFEWNKIAKATEVKEAKLYPIVSKFHLKLQLAPAIAVEKKMMCGHSIEVNVRSEIDISITDLHISLGYVLFQQLNSAVTSTMATLRNTTGNETDSFSGTGSRVKKRAAKPIPVAQYVSMVYPVNVLMTACDIAVTLIGGAGKQAIASFNFSQPHTILCTKPKSERLELSCYDVKVLVRESVHQPSAPDVLLGLDVRLDQALLHTLQGVPDSKTGIYPAAFTFKVTKYLSKPEISVVNGRPVCLALPVHSLHGLSAALEHMLPAAGKSASHPDVSKSKSVHVEDECVAPSHLGCKALDIHTLFPLESISLKSCQLAGEIRLADEMTAHIGVASTCTHLSLSATAESGQLDAGLLLSCDDVELALSSRQFKAKLIGPLSFTANPEVTLSTTHPFTSTCTISSPVLPVQLGNESLKLAARVIQELSSFSPAVAGKHAKGDITSTPSGSAVSRRDYYDDLRQGSFKYRLDEEQRIPRANTVLFYSDRDYSTLAWTYTEPRVLTSVHINPIPFDYPTDQRAAFHCSDIQIQCSLEWWNNSEQQYVAYSTFAISEQFGTSVSLPFIGSTSCTPALTWRIVINYYIDRSYTADYSFEHVFAMVSPAVLVAAMKVDSVYMPELIPALQMSVAIEQIRVSVLNQYSVSNSRGFHDKLSPFLLDDCDVLDHELFNILINKARLEGSLWNLDGQETSLKADLVFDVLARHLDYRHLVWQNCMQMVGSDVEAVVKHSPAHKQSQVTLKSGVKELEFIASQSLFNAILHLHHVWGGADRPRPLTGLYAICNNTHTNLFIRQRKCEDESIVCIASGQAHSFCWSRHNDLRLELAVEELANQWSTPVELDVIGQQVAGIPAVQTAAVHLVVDIEKVTSIHRMVTVSGSVCVSSRLSTTELDVKLSTGLSHRLVKVSPGRSFGSFAVSTEGELELRVKPTSTDCSSYSNSLSVISAAAKSTLSASHLLKIGGEDFGELHAFYSVHTRVVCGVTQYLVEITPIYSVRSYIPHSLMLNVLPSTHTRLEGNSTTTELTSVSGTRPHQISLQLSESDIHGTVMLPLTTDKLSTLSDLLQYSHDLTILQICRQSLGGDKSVHTRWPCSSQSIILSGKSRPLSLQRGESVAAGSLTIHYTQSDSVGLDIDWTQRWPGTPSLLMTIKPRCVFVNQSAADLTLVYNNEFCVLHTGETVLQPSKLSAAFHVGAYNSKRLFLSELIHISNEEVTPRSFFIQHETILFMDSYVYGSVVILNSDETIHKLLYLVITSHTDCGVRVITLHDRFVFDNRLADSLYMSMLIAPISSDRVAIGCVHKNPRLLEGNKAISLDYHTLSTSHVLSSSAAALFLAFSFSSKGEWSYPVQIPIESVNRRLGVAIPSPSESRPCSLLTHIVNGVTYITLMDTRVPSLVIHNCCSFPVAFGQTLTRDSEDVLESMSLLAQPPSVLPGGMALYSFPAVNKQFPVYVEEKDYPKLKLAGMNGHYGVEVWCEGINVCDISTPKFINIPDVGGAKVSFGRQQLNTHLYVEPVDRAKVTAKEVKVGSGDVYYLTAMAEQGEGILELPPPAPDTEESTPKGEFNLSIKVLMEKVSMLFLDEELSTPSQSPEVLRLIMEGAGVELSRMTSSVNDGKFEDVIDLSVYVLSTTVYNQLWHSRHFDFPVVAMAQHPLRLDTFTSSPDLMSIEQQSLLSLKLRLSNNQLLSVGVSSKPVVLNIEDIFLQSLLTLTDSYLTSVSILPVSTAVKSECIVPHSVRISSQKSEISLLELSIDKLDLLVSFHASVKVFVASDQAPISLGPFHRLHIVSTYEQLVTDLAFHYGTGALYSAGWVVGSLELLFNPTGMIRSFMAGMSDLVYLPYHGLQRGPGAFVTGVSQGLTSAVRNVTRGTLTSVSLFAQSVSKNMDRLSMDGSHYERQERMRHQKPQALSQGLSQGFKGLAYSFLGAVAGLADEPLQGLWGEHASATGLVRGVGKGLLGAVTKPISGTAELISQTGQGLMNSVGLSAGGGQPLTQAYDAFTHRHGYTTLKYRWRYPLLHMHHGETLCAIRGSSMSCGEEELTMLLLHPQLVIVMDCRENIQQQAFALSEIDCHKYEQNEANVYLQLILTGQEQSPRITDSSLLTKHRIEEYVDSTTSGYQSGVGETTATSSSHYHSCADSLLLHEYCVPATDVDFFIAMFRYAKDALGKG